MAEHNKAVIKQVANTTKAPPGMMRAARLHRVNEPLSIDHVPKPVARPGEVLVQVKACGLVPNYDNALQISLKYPMMAQPRLPAIYGLDVAGVVVEIGPQVHDFSIGDRVYVNPARYCGGCRFCHAGKFEACDSYILSGYLGSGSKAQVLFDEYPIGGLAEFMPAPQYALVRIPDTLSFEMAARWGYLGTGYAALRRANVNMSTNVLINGISGTLGLGAALFALALGAPRILGLGRNMDLLRKVQAVAPNRIHVRSVDGDESIAAWAHTVTEGEGLDVVIDALPTAASPVSFLAARAALARGGCHVNIGGVTADVPINFLELIAKAQTFIGSMWFTTAQGQEMADLARTGLVNLDVFKHQVFALEEINTALKVMGGRDGGFTNYVISPDVKAS